MIISIKRGHLTQTEKSHLKEIFKAKIMTAKVNRKYYYLEKTFEGDENGYKVNIKESGKDDLGNKKVIKNTAFFNIKHIKN